ncbi:MAG: membrane-associated protease RseP (regulator of RpoE activity), partial [Planctomycetota bacterium]
MHALTASLLSLFLIAPLASGWLGVYLSQDSKEAVVSEVIPGTPAAKAGLESGDIMLAVGDTLTPTRETFMVAIQSQKSGTRVNIKLRRDNRERVVVVRLGDRPENIGAGAGTAVEPAQPRLPKPTPVAKPTRSAPAVETAPRGQDAVVRTQKGYLGISVREGDGGLVVDRILEGGPSAKSGLEQGDVLKSIGDQRIRSLDDLDGALKKIHPGQKVSLGVVSKDAKKSLVITVGRRPSQGRIAIDGPVEVIEISRLGAESIEEVKPERGQILEVVPIEVTEEVVIEEVEAEEVEIEEVVIEEVVIEEVETEEVVIEVIPSEAKPGRRATRTNRRAARPPAPPRAARPARPAQQNRANRPNRPNRPTVTGKPGRPSSPSRGKGVRGRDYNLERELKE